MEDITKIDVDRIIALLKENTATSNVAEKIKLAEILEKAEIIPNMMIATYVKAVNRAIKTIEVKQDDQIDGETINGLNNELKSLNLDHVNYSKSKLEAVKVMFDYAEERKNMICDFDDSKHPRTIIGRCQYENHYEDIDISSLTEDEQKAFEELNEAENWFVACDKFKDKLNPDNQTLTITLSIDDDQKKYDDQDPEYVCERCMEEIADNCEGYASCDMEE
jgi:hypothetical protein